ncbi:hypothetical protein PO124_03270 [Bacillus licheniformis]|nr:hypothetical protein [Bacillus licheniformis]
MDWLEFVSAMVQSLAWPAALMICVLLLKEPLSDRMKELIKLKYKDLNWSLTKGFRSSSPYGKKVIGTDFCTVSAARET